MYKINDFVKVKLRPNNKIEEGVVKKLYDNGYLTTLITSGEYKGYEFFIHTQDIVQEKLLMITAKEARKQSLENLPVALAKIERFIKDNVAKGLTEIIISNLWLNQDIIATLISHPYYYKVESVPGDAHKISW